MIPNPHIIHSLGLCKLAVEDCPICKVFPAHKRKHPKTPTTKKTDPEARKKALESYRRLMKHFIDMPNDYFKKYHWNDTLDHHASWDDDLTDEEKEELHNLTYKEFVDKYPELFTLVADDARSSDEKAYRDLYSRPSSDADDIDAEGNWIEDDG